MIRSIEGLRLHIHPLAYLAENATVVGAVTLEEGAGIWYGAVLRGDCGAITVGAGSHLQDNVTVHDGTTIGRNVLVGHNAVVHGCTVEDGALIGMNATVLNGAVIGRGSLIAAGCLVTKGTVIPAGSLVMGVPGRVVRQLSEAEQAQLLANAKAYDALARAQLPLAGELFTK